MASPIAHFLRDLRVRTGQTQLQLACLLGYEQAYVSAVELGVKSPSSEFVTRLIHKLEINEVDRGELEASLNMSRRRLTVPVDAPRDVFLLINELADKLADLHPVQVNGMRTFLQMDEQMKERPSYKPTRIKRRSRTEAQM